MVLLPYRWRVTLIFHNLYETLSSIKRRVYYSKKYFVQVLNGSRSYFDFKIPKWKFRITCSFLEKVSHVSPVWFSFECEVSLVIKLLRSLLKRENVVSHLGHTLNITAILQYYRQRTLVFPILYSQWFGWHTQGIHLQYITSLIKLGHVHLTTLLSTKWI